MPAQAEATTPHTNVHTCKCMQIGIQCTQTLLWNQIPCLYLNIEELLAEITNTWEAEA